MPKLVTWMNNQRVGELTKLANGAHTFKYAPEWLASRYARPLSLSLPLQRGNITSDAVFNFFDNLLPDSPIVRDRIVKRYHAKSRQPFDLLSEIGRDSVGAVTLLPENETITRPIMAWEKLTEARLEEVLTAYKADIPLGMIREENDFRISVAGAQEKTALLRIGNDWCIPKGITPTTHIIKLPIGEIPGLPVVDWRNGWPCKKLLRIYSGWRQLSTHAILRHHFSISGPWRYGNTHQRSQTGNGA